MAQEHRRSMGRQSQTCTEVELGDDGGKMEAVGELRRRGRNAKTQLSSLSFFLFKRQRALTTTSLFRLPLLYIPALQLRDCCATISGSQCCMIANNNWPVFILHGLWGWS